MTRQRYSLKESTNRILRLFQGKAVATDVPDTITGDVLSVDEAISDLAELLAGSLPNETASLPSAITVPVANIPTGSFSAPSHVHSQYLTGTSVQPTYTTLQVGTYPNIAYISSDGTFRLTGTATAFDDLRVDGLNTRAGVIAPTDEVGFRGNSAFQVRNFVHNQADEVQFDIQYPHHWQEGGIVEPHVHFSPWITGTQAVQAAKFILEYYWANVNGTFPASPSTYEMVYTWTGSNQWDHRIADGNGITGTGFGLSSIMKCRLYRDNTVTNNLAGKVTFLYFDVHYNVDGFGSSDEYAK